MPRSEVSKEVYNKQRRDHYAANRDEINKRRRELYAEKKKLSKGVSLDTDEIRPSESFSKGEKHSISGEVDHSLTGTTSESLMLNDNFVGHVEEVIEETTEPMLTQTSRDDVVHNAMMTQQLHVQYSLGAKIGDIQKKSHQYEGNLGSKQEYNKQRRDRYVANKDEINKRRRQLYAEKKKSTRGVNQNNNEISSNQNMSQAKETIGSSSHSGFNQESINDPAQNGTVTGQLNIQDTLDVHADDGLIKNVHRDILRKSQRYQGDLGQYIVSRLTPTDQRTIILPKAAPCRHCGAYKFYKETDRFCCGNGEISLVGTALPLYLVELITGTDARCKDFQNMIRTYNNHFAFTSIGMKCDDTYQHRNQGIYTVKVQGQVHHYLNDLLPHQGRKKLQGIQFYFYDSEHQVENRLASLPRLNPSIVIELVNLMKSYNPYTQFLKLASELDKIDDYHLVIRADPGLDQRTYNLPTSSEVAGIWLDDESDSVNHAKLWDIRVYCKSGYSHQVQYYYGCYDPLQYVLMFPKGETGWHGNIPRVGHTLRRGRRLFDRTRIRDFVSFEDLIRTEEEGITRSMFHDIIPNDDRDDSSVSQGRGRATVSCREYYVYRLQVRPNDRSYLLRFGRLLQQFVIDNYIKLETMRLDYLERNQQKMRINHYQGLIDSVIAGIPKGGQIGKRVYLPATFIGGPRDMKHRYLDSMALVQEHGKPDLFLTMTCNPNWPEIKELLNPGEEAQNRPDLLARVFKSKLGILHDLLMKGDIFGKIASVVHVVEFQKRGLPHAHFLVILQPAYRFLTPEGYDRIVSAELPDEREENYLYGLVVKHMMHGPCGELNPENVCMRDHRCKNHYPKDFNEQTSHGKGTYPLYRRRDNNRKAKVRGKVLDNRWVIPYNPTLLMLFNCHINVEICCDIRAVKYLYKYIHKGHDKVMFRVSPDSPAPGADEIKDFQKGRWVSPVEAAWRLYGFPLHDMYPPVLQLQVHTPNFQTIAFEDDADLEELLKDARLKRSMLGEFFRINREDPHARKLNLLYKEFPKHYVWDVQSRTWGRRKRRPVVGRLAVVNPVENERYYLRVLLSNVRCPTSFEDLLTVNGTTCDSFQESALKRGLLHSDDDVDKTMEEASVYKMPGELRRLFATLLHYCRPSDARKLFDTYFEHMAEDFRRLQHQLNLTHYDVQCKVLEGINDTLESLGRDVNDFRLVSFKYTSSDFERYTREIAAEKSIPIPDEDLHSLHLLNHKQKEAFHVIFNKAMVNEGGVFFVDGPGGTGKSFLYKVLLAHIRSKGFIGLIVASSGIAASGFLGGRTAHSRFKIPIDTERGVKCQIAKESSDADLIRASRILIWDEAPMAHQAVIHALDDLLKDICECAQPFGGKLVVFGGDFRQVLPVVKGGGRIQQINASIISSKIWEHFIKLELTENMRARTDPDFVDYLMRIGNGEEPTNARGGQFMGNHVWIPRIPLEPNPADNKYSIPFVRRQIPLRLCFAMTINKSQGQTLDYVGVYLRQPVFTHGQLYVALSRAKTGKNIKVFQYMLKELLPLSCLPSPKRKPYFFPSYSL